MFCSLRIASALVELTLAAGPWLQFSRARRPRPLRAAPRIPVSPGASITLGCHSLPPVS